MVFIFYLLLWFAPMKYLHRRPAVIPYSKWVAILMGCILLVNTTILVTAKDGLYCVDVLLYALADLVQPFIIYRALLDDSQVK